MAEPTARVSAARIVDDKIANKKSEIHFVKTRKFKSSITDHVIRRKISN